MVPFDYSALQPAVASRAQAAAERIRTRMRDSFIEVGTELIAVKEGLDRRQFLGWLRAEFGVSERSADNYMGAARLAKDRIANFANAQPSVLYMLAAPRVPEQVRDQLLTAVDNGEHLTVKKVKEAIGTLATRSSCASRRRRRSRGPSLAARQGRHGKKPRAAKGKITSADKSTALQPYMSLPPDARTHWGGGATPQQSIALWRHRGTREAVPHR
jgi:hypothetical protein